MGATAQSWQGIAPCAEVAGLSAALAGQLALLLDTLTRYWQQSARQPTHRGLAAVVATIAGRFFSAAKPTGSKVYSASCNQA